MASGKRASELAAFGSTPPYCVFPHKDRVILGYLPGFLAKNESLEKLHGPCVLDSLRLITPDKDESALCPVRTLRQYLETTKSSSRIPQLFRKAGTNSPLTAAAISRSLVDTIRAAYTATSGLATLTGQVKGHDVRAVAASLQMRNFPSWTALRSSYGWTTPNVFITHYGRGESALSTILVDSFTCITLHLSDSWPRLLEEAYNAFLPSTPFRVLPWGPQKIFLFKLGIRTLLFRLPLSTLLLISDPGSDVLCTLYECTVVNI